MEKEFVPYDLSLRLKELGFDEPCLAYHNQNGIIIEEIASALGNNKICLAPTFSQCFRWFREKYDWQTSIIPTRDQHRFEVGYNYWIWNSKNGEEYHTEPKDRPCGDWIFKTHEEAELTCLEKLIEIVENKSE